MHVRHVNRISLLGIVLATLALGSGSLSAQGESSDKRQFDISPQSLDSALLEFSEQAELQLVVAASSLEGMETRGFAGQGTPEKALAALLDGADLKFSTVGATVTITDAGGSERQEGGISQSQPDDEEDAEANMPGSETLGVGESDSQEEDGEDDPLELEASTVTGSRITVSARELPSQVIVLSYEDLRNTGAPTLEQALRQLPQNINGTTEFGGARLYQTPDSSGALLGTSNINGSSTINLRGLGESATLVLIDGKRAGDSGMLGGFTDISEIPVSIVERVEVQLDGASAIYGSDAIGGVVNIILKKDYDILRATLRRTARTRGGLSEHNASVAAGTAWDSGNVSLSVDAYQASEQDVGRTDLNLLGVEQYAYPGNVRGRRGSVGSPREISRSLTQAARDAGLIGPDETVRRAAIPAGQDGTGLTVDDFLATVNTFGTNEGVSEPISVTPESKRYTFRVAANQRIADWLRVAGGVTYSTRRTSSNSRDALGEMEFEVAEENPYNPFGRDVEVDMTVLGFGTRVVSGSRDSLTLDLDFDGVLGDEWRWEIRSRFADRKTEAETLNWIDKSRLNDLVDDTRSDPSNALNVFGNSFLTDGNNADVLASGDFRIPVQRSETTNRLASSELIVKREMFSLPAGKARAVAGMEWRRVSVDVDYGNTFVRVITAVAPYARGAITEGFALKGTRTVRAGFAEFLFPIFSKNNSLPGIRDLNIMLSGRHESAAGSSSAGIETNSRYQSNVWSAGLTYRPIQAVKLRVNRSTSYRAPDVAHALFPPLVSRRRALDFRTNGFRVADLQETSGGNPTLQPEESISVTGGIEIAPVSLLQGLTLSVDYHDTQYQNRIAQLNIFGNFIISDGTMDRFGYQYTLDEEGRITAFDSRADNIWRIDTQGLDYRLGYQRAIGESTLRLSASLAITNNYLEDINTYDQEGAREHVGLYVSKRRYRAGVSWVGSGWSLTLNARSRSGLAYERGQPLMLAAEGSVSEDIQVTTKPAVVVDFRGTFEISEAWSAAPGFMRNVSLAFGLNNIFRSYDKVVLDPEPFAGLRGRPRGTNNVRGQLYYLEITRDF